MSKYRITEYEPNRFRIEIKVLFWWVNVDPPRIGYQPVIFSLLEAKDRLAELMAEQEFQPVHHYPERDL